MDWSQSTIVQLPAPASDDPLCTQKHELMAQKGLTFVFTISNLTSDEQHCQLVDAMLKVARILNLNEIEWYFTEEDEDGPFSPRNELEALHLICRSLCQLNGFVETRDSLETLKDMVLIKLNSFPVPGDILRPGIPCPGDKESMLLRWARSQGIKSKLDVAVFEGFGRGAMAAEEISIGDIILEIPQHAIICEDTIVKTDMFLALRDEEGISGETMALLWSMRERHNPQSTFAPYFASLPESFNTGLSFGLAGLKGLEGTMVLEEILQAKEHLQLQYNTLFPTLTGLHPHFFPEKIYTWELFLWACELWYSNGLKIAFPDGTIKTCLVPVAGLLNHGLYPHITHFSKVDSASQKLSLRAARPCKTGQQCFLSYGAFSNSHLLTFYGFLLGSDNPFDNVPIDIDLSDDPLRYTLVEKSNLGFSHMIRGSCLSKTQLSPFRLPSRLLATLRIAHLEDDEVESLCFLPRHAVVGVENEIKAHETLLSILTSMLESVEQSSSSSEDADTSGWDVTLATAFKDGQRELIQSACRCCSMPLKALTS